MKFTSDLQWNLLCFKQCCLFWMWVIPKAFLSSSSDAIWIQNKTNSEHKKKHNEKKQQKGDAIWIQNKANNEHKKNTMKKK